MDTAGLMAGRRIDCMYVVPGACFISRRLSRLPKPTPDHHVIQHVSELIVVVVVIVLVIA